MYEDARSDEAVIEAVQANAQLILDLTQEVNSLRSLLSSIDHAPAVVAEPPADEPSWNEHGDSIVAVSACDAAIELESELQQWRIECDRLRRRVRMLEDGLSETQQRNGQLASELSNQSVEAVVTLPSESCESLSWEERKQLLMQQMDSDGSGRDLDHTAVDAGASSGHDASEFNDRLHAQVEARDREITELRELLEQQILTSDGGVAIDAAEIAELIDNDELIKRERMRLQQLQSEWEEKFREEEIESSLERARLSRERQEVARKRIELEVQLDRLRRENKDPHAVIGGRRWLTKLGLADDES